jgi:hypothetical protein
VVSAPRWPYTITPWWPDFLKSRLTTLLGCTAAPASGFTLYSAALLAPLVTWSGVTNTLSATNGEFTAVVPASPGQRFFQLRRP